MCPWSALPPSLLHVPSPLRLASLGLHSWMKYVALRPALLFRELLLNYVDGGFIRAATISTALPSPSPTWNTLLGFTACILWEVWEAGATRPFVEIKKLQLARGHRMSSVPRITRNQELGVNRM